MRQYADPRIFSSMIFGTEGQRAAGTRENDTPSVTISTSANALLGNAGSRNAKLRWHTIMMMAPAISIDAPFPLKSRKAPRNGVSTIARIGKQLNRREAVSAVTPRVISR